MIPLIKIFRDIADIFRAHAKLNQARRTGIRPTEPGERHIGFVAVIGDSYHAETADGRSLGSFPTNEEAAKALSNAATAEFLLKTAGR